MLFLFISVVNAGWTYLAKIGTNINFTSLLRTHSAGEFFAFGQKQIQKKSQ